MPFSKFDYLKSLHGRKLKPAHFRVLITMLDHANGDGTRSHRGVAGLATDCDMHVETVKKAVRWLRDNGYVIETYSGWRHGGASIYSFPPRPQGSLTTSLEPEGREAKTGESPAIEGSPQASPPEEDQKDPSSLTGSRQGAWTYVALNSAESTALSESGEILEVSGAAVGGGSSSTDADQEVRRRGHDDPPPTGPLVELQQVAPTTSGSTNHDYAVIPYAAHKGDGNLRKYYERYVCHQCKRFTLDHGHADGCNATRPLEAVR